MNNDPVSKKTTTRSSFLARCFGHFRWDCPPWFSHFRHKTAAHPIKAWGSLILVSIALSLMIFAYCWYQHQPKPELITAQITPPPITALAETLEPGQLIIDFGFRRDEWYPQAVAPLAALNHDVSAGVIMKPAIKGSWAWDGDSRLIFTPDEDWPAGQLFSIKFANDFFADKKKMASLSYSFSTLSFEAKISDFSLYQDPTNPDLRQAVATVSFNFPVDPDSFKTHVSLMFQALKEGKIDLDASKLTLDITYDEHKRTAYIRSESLTIGDAARFIVLRLEKGIKSATGSAEIEAEMTKNLLIPDKTSYFKVNAVNALILRNEQDKPQQVLAIETSLGVTEDELNKSVHLYMLPDNYPATRSEAEKSHYEWQNPGEVSSIILANSTPIALKSIPADTNYATLHSYTFKAAQSRYLFLKIDKGTKGFGHFSLNQDYVAVMKVPDFPQEISFLHRGALLALSSEKKLSVLVRGLPAVKFEIARVLPDNINQLVSQTEGDFNNPYFVNQRFNQQNISQLFSEIQTFDASDFSKEQYSALDLEKYLASETGGGQGLFLLQANAWDLSNNVPLDVKTSRLILITNLGMLVKDNSNGTHDVFVQSIIDGLPVANIEVAVLGKNGLPILTRTTDSDGRANFPSLTDFVEDREPTVYIAKKDNDVSFIPYQNANRQLNFSRFDIGGIYTNQQSNSLSAYIFSDRGIYRPGDTAHLAFIVKEAFAAPTPAGFPLQITITDPRGSLAFDQKYTLNSSNYLSLDFITQATSLTGQYFVNLYTVKDNHADNLLGSTSFKVAEFLPDRLRIKAQLSGSNAEQAWVSPSQLGATVFLQNLYGAPAIDRRVSGKLVLSPEAIHFAKFPDYIFSDPLIDPNKPAKGFSEDLTDAKTDEQGKAHFSFNLERFEKATYRLRFFAEGFEAEGGRSVSTETNALVSPLAYFVGYKADGDLAYIKQHDQRSVHIMAVNSSLKPESVNDLRVQWLSLLPVTTLVRKENGSYQYQSIIQSTVIQTDAFSLSETGANYALPTARMGDFALRILNAENTELSRINFTVVGASQQALAKNAELSVTLNKNEFNAGETIELQIVAPYTGAGLITIERDKVYATHWFKTDTTNSLQSIRVPDDFQGDGYVNVAFIRDWDSPEIFINPLSYNVLPFYVNNDNHRIAIELNTPAVARPGTAFPIRYKTDKPGKIIVFAVDEGILQVAHYALPDPLAFFFQKHALEVITQQTVDQILPKYIRERELSAVGGDDGDALLASHLNPFKRKTDLPVVFWSGIVDTDSTERELVYTIPDSFNGAMRVMAVAVNSDSLGSAEKQTEVRGDFIILPNAPTFVAPGDEFEVSASIANNIKASGQKLQTTVHLDASEGLEIIGSDKMIVAIDEGKEGRVHFKLRANSQLGSETLTLIATAEDKSTAIKTSLSIRPALPFTTSIQTGDSTKASLTLPVAEKMYNDYRDDSIAMSTSPLILMSGLQRYLDNFPYGCTEQLVSKVMPLVAMPNQPWFQSKREVVNEKLANTLQVLSQRQLSNGSFSYWPHSADKSNNAFVSVYAMHFLTEVRALNYSVSNDLFYAGIAYLKELVTTAPVDLAQARIKAYAIYVLTLNELVTTNYLANLQLYLDSDKSLHWQEDIVGAYIAATYQLLKSSEEAEKLILQYNYQQKNIASSTDFYDSNSANAQYLYLLAKHFPHYLPDLQDKLLYPLINVMNNDDINTIFSGYMSLALGAYGESITPPRAPLSVSMTIANQQQALSSSNDGYIKASIPLEVSDLMLVNPEKRHYFYQLTQAGFNKTLPDKADYRGLEIYREYRSMSNEPLQTAKLGEDVEVIIRVRSLSTSYLNNVAIIDLLPGGFEVVQDSIDTQSFDYTDVRDDRVIFFTDVSDTAKTFRYRIKSVSLGVFSVPPIIAESMYNPMMKALSAASSIQVIPTQEPS